MKKLVLLTLLFSLLLGACATSQPSDLSSKSLPGTATPAPANPPTSLPADAVIEYTRSGGITGKTQAWLIYADGRVVGPNGQQDKVDPTIVTRMVSEFDAIGLANFPAPISPEKNTCADCFTYQVTLRSSGEEHTFTAQDSQPDVPESFWKALTDLQSIFMAQPK